MTLIGRLKGLFSTQTAANQRVQLEEAENDFLVGTSSLNTFEFDRPQYSRKDILTQCLDAWRYNPLARRITEIISQYVVGAGFTVSNPNAKKETCKLS